LNPNDDVIEHDDLLSAQLIDGFDEMLFLMMRFTKQQLIKELVDDTPITPPQFGLLWCLSTGGCNAVSANDASQTMSEISDNMQLSHGAATGLVDRLQRLGLVERNRSEVDRRVVSIHISDEGEKLVQRIHTRRREVLRKMLTRLNPEERQLLLKIDSMMKDMLTNDEE
jgi:DNA-binding MarR family transcriptional regulator